MRTTFCAIGVALAAIVATWALFLDLAILYETHGLWSSVVGLVLAPITYVVVPWYAGLTLDDWLPLAVWYGSVAVGIVFARLGSVKVSPRS
jgi:hypothetical protein